MYFYFIFYIQIFFWINFRYVAKLLYLKIGKSSNSAKLVVQLLFWNRWNQESAGRVYFNISREKPTHTPDTPHVQQLSRANLNGPIRETFIVFLLKSIRDNLAPGFPRALDLYPRHAQKSSGSRLFEKAFFIILNRDDWYIFRTILVSLCFFYPFIIP